MNSFTRRVAALLCVCCSGVAVTAWAQMETPAPTAAAATTPPTTGPAARTSTQVIQELQATAKNLRVAMPSFSAISDEAFRKGDGQKAVPLLKKMSDDLKELGQLQGGEQGAETASSHYQFDAINVALGDTGTVADLDKEAKGGTPTAVNAQSALALGNWIKSSKDAEGQKKVLADYTTIIKANPTSDVVAMTLGTMANLGPANDDITKQVMDLVRKNLKGDAAKQMIAQADADDARKQMIGKPLVIAGRTSTGASFTSTQYKGKVVLVDFWATWCGPCKEGLPEVKAVYEANHSKGLEMVGVSCDQGDDVLNTFVKENTMPWVQLREASQTGDDSWHPLAKKLGIDAIPTMFLIDKKGNLRYVDAREDLSKKVEALLAETDGPATQPATK